MTDKWIRRLFIIGVVLGLLGSLIMVINKDPYTKNWATLLALIAKKVWNNPSDVNQTQTVDANQTDSTTYPCYSDPQQALDTFLDHLHNQDYVAASQLYIDPYPFTLSDIPPESMTTTAKTEFVATFLENHCEGHGTYLAHRIDGMEKRSDEEYWFGVVFYNTNGDLVLPVIPEKQSTDGSNEGTSYAFKVTRDNGCFMNWGLPPNTP